MSLVDWKGLAREKGFRVSADDTITVPLDGGGTQVIRVESAQSGTALHITSTVARARTVDRVAVNGESQRYAWERNRLSEIVGFTIDRQGRLIGEAWIPIAGLNSAELEVYLNELARICDWHEFRLAGEDLY